MITCQSAERIEYIMEKIVKLIQKFGAIVATAKEIYEVAKPIIDPIVKSLSKTGTYGRDKTAPPNSEWFKRLTKLRTDMQREIKQNQQKELAEIVSNVNDIFKQLQERFKNMDITRLQSMLNDTISDNQKVVDSIIHDELSVDNYRLRKIARCIGEDERSKQYTIFFAELTDKIEQQILKNIHKLYDETLKNAHDAYDEEYNKKRMIIDSQIKDLSRMIDDNSNSQTNSEDVLIENFQKKIACQLIIDAVENVNE